MSGWIDRIRNALRGANNEQKSVRDGGAGEHTHDHGKTVPEAAEHEHGKEGHRHC